MVPPFQKTIILLIDALRYDFALYNTSLKEVNALPYQNKMPVFGEMVKQHPRQARLSPFMADAPTTTMQRLKGLTTGSLPTFIDASNNFASEEIDEDNIIDQLVRHGRRITVLGDDTWGGLFPGRFSRSHLYSSFNVMDLHTVDRGVETHLGEELARPDWEVMLGHFLGVDHCGHRYGPNHPQMAAKLTQMNEVVKQVIASMDNSTLLLVLGDHGMTQTGDHGGDSKEELEAALFVYSPALRLPPAHAFTPPVAQVDLVPTLALALGVPIPFSSLGKVMEDVLVTAEMTPKEADKQKHLGLSVNMRQVKRYLSAYRELGNSYPQDLWHGLERLEQETSEELPTGVQKAAFADYLILAKLMCEEIWVRFDVLEMVGGLCLMFSVLVLAGSFVYCNILTDIKVHIIKRILILTVIVNLLFALSHFLNFVILSYAASALVLLWIYAHKENFPISKFGVIDYISLSLISIVLLGSFSNSFVVMENYIVSFILLSCLTVYLILFIFKAQGKKGTSLTGKVSRLLSNLPNMVCLTGWAVALVCVRCSGWFWRCREEQYWCSPSQVQVPLSGLPQSLHNWRYFTSLLALALVVLLPRRWLLLCGNMNGNRLGVLLARTVPVVCGVLVAVWWAIQAFMAAHNLDIWGHVIPPRVTFGAGLVYVLVLSCVPLLTYELPSSSSRRNRQLVSDNPSVLIPQLCKNLMEKYNSKKSFESSIPVVYGLATSMSAPLVAVLMVVTVVVVMVAGDGLSGAVLLLLLTASASLLLMALWILKTSQNLREIVKPGWPAACVWFILSIHGFYTTGHQPTFPSLHWAAAFVGLEGDEHIGNWAPALLVGLNTFSTYVLFGLSLPLVVIVPLAISVIFPNLRGTCLEGVEAARGEFLLVEDPDMARESLLSAALSYTFLHAAKVACTSLAALVLRRHLMLWKIFAPHFIFEALGFLVTLLSVLAGLGFTLRVLGALSSWSERLLKAT